MTQTDSLTESLTEAQWQIAHAIAQTLVKEEADVNEFGKAIAYLRATVHLPNAGSNFFKYLKTLVSNSRQISHSSKTPEYYRSIDKTCSQHLRSEQVNAETMLLILGWAARLTRYYKEVSPIGENSAPVTEPTRKVEIPQTVSTPNFTVGQILEAKITAIKGNKVTYEIMGTIKLTEKEPKKAESLSDGQVVKVEVLDLKEDGSIRKVKCSE